MEDISGCRIILSQIKNLLRVYHTYTVDLLRYIQANAVVHALARNSIGFPQAYSFLVMPHSLYSSYCWDGDAWFDLVAVEKTTVILFKKYPT